MPTFEVHGRIYEVDEDGFLEDPSSGTKTWPRTLPSTEAITELTENHWKVINYIRNYYLQFGIAPMIRKVCKETGFKLNEIYKLFPSGPGQGRLQTGRTAETDGLRLGNAMSARRRTIARAVDRARPSSPIRPAAAAFLAGEKRSVSQSGGPHAARGSHRSCSTSCTGNMDADRIAPALDAHRAHPCGAGFHGQPGGRVRVSAEPILLELKSAAGGADVPLGVLLSDRIDQLALMAFDLYMQCREQLCRHSGERRPAQDSRAASDWAKAGIMNVALFADRGSSAGPGRRCWPDEETAGAHSSRWRFLMPRSPSFSSASAIACCAGPGLRCPSASPPLADSRNRFPGSRPPALDNPSAPAGASWRAWLWRFCCSARCSATTGRELHDRTGYVFGESKLLWLGALAFHWSLLVILLRHLRLLVEPVPAFVAGACQLWTASSRSALRTCISPTWSSWCALAVPAAAALADPLVRYHLAVRRLLRALSAARHRGHRDADALCHARGRGRRQAAGPGPGHLPSGRARRAERRCSWCTCCWSACWRPIFRSAS